MSSPTRRSVLVGVRGRRRASLAVAAVALVGGGAAAGTAHAGNVLRADLVGSGETFVLVSNAGTKLYAKVKNTGQLRAPATTASIRYQPVTRLRTPTGQTFYVNQPGSTAITATGAVDPLSPGAVDQFGATTVGGATPAGLNRITVCADSTGAVAELSETNNCYSEIKEVVAAYWG